MPIVYNTCGGTSVPAHICKPCALSEKGGVRGAAFISKAYMKFAADGSIDPSVGTDTYWKTGIEAGDILVIGETSGTFDGGTPKMGKGRGDVKERVIGKDFVLTFSDFDHTDNEKFWAALEKAAGEYYVAFRTETELRVSDAVVSSSVKDNVEEDIESEVAWTAEVKWFQSKGTVQIFDLSPVKQYFACFTVEP